MPYKWWSDIQRKCILPDDQGSEQGKEALENQDDDFDDMIWSDEYTVQLQDTDDFVAEKSVMHPSQNPSTQVVIVL